MGVACSSFSKSHHSERGIVPATHGSKKTFFHTVVSKLKLKFDKGQVNSAAPGNAAGVAAARTTTSITPTAPPIEGGLAARTTTTTTSTTSTAPCNEATVAERTSITTPTAPGVELPRSGQLSQTLNKAVPQRGNNIPSQQKSDAGKELKPLAKESVEVKMKQMVDSSSKNRKESAEIFPCSDDEDVCPTCLEDYTEENPKITTRCDHHFHLPCIFEWMQRSNSCPVCDKFMEFDQMA